MRTRESDSLSLVNVLGTTHVGVLASIASATLFVVAYAFPWLSWLVWVSLVPFLLAVRGRNRPGVYAVAIPWVLLYSGFVIYVTDMWRLARWTDILLVLVPFLLLTAESNLRAGHLSRWGWILPPIVWTFIAVLFGQASPTVADSVASMITIVPVSQPIFELIVGTYWTYVLFFAVLMVNYALSEAIARSRGRKTWGLAAATIVCAMAMGLSGGPIVDMPFSSPEGQGMDSAMLTKLDRYIQKSFRQIRSLVVVRRGYIVFERYYQGTSPFSFNEVASVTKSFTSALAGIALKQGYIHGVQERAIDFFPEYSGLTLPPQAKEITLEHLLTMTSGFEWDEILSSVSFAEWRDSDDPVKFFFELPIAKEPASAFNYNTPGAHVVSAIVDRTSHMTRSEFADRYLFGPLGIYRRIWQTDARGINYGGHSLKLRVRDMAKFGSMYLSHGAFAGKQIIPADYVEASTRAHIEAGPPENEDYGYLWWVTQDRGHAVFMAAGYGGQFIYVVPDLELVVAITSDTLSPHTENRAIVGSFIIPSIMAED